MGGSGEPAVRICKAVMRTLKNRLKQTHKDLLNPTQSRLTAAGFLTKS